MKLRNFPIKQTFAIFVLLFLLAPYYIFDDGGFVALRETQTGKIFRSETPVSMLPEGDARAVRSEIPCDSATEAKKRMENFCS